VAKKTKTLINTYLQGFHLEAPTGFEPVDQGFADLCLTAWLWRRIKLLKIKPQRKNLRGFISSGAVDET
jgi:hypothetical protein